jgi:hypothetical protein
MIFMFSGFFFMAMGAVVSGVMFEFLSYPLQDSFVVESLFDAIGLGFIVYSIYGVS